MQTQIKIQNEKIELKFFSRDSIEFYNTLDRVKQIPGRQFVPSAKLWTVPLSLQSIEEIAKAGFDLTEDLLCYMEKEKKEVEQIEKEIEEIDFDSDILYDYQVKHAKKIIASIIKNNAALDASDTGTGKTFVALAVAKYFDLFPVIITPKSVIPSWEKVAKMFNIHCSASNYEQYRNGNTRWVQKLIVKEKEIFKWSTNERHLLIWDEAHKTKNYTTQNAKMLKATTKTNSKILCLSATIADNPLHLNAVGKTLGLFSTSQDFWRWAYTHGVYKGKWGIKFNGTKENLNKIHKDIFPELGSRISIKELGDKFPSNKIILDTYNMNSNGQKIQNVYKDMKKEIKYLSATKTKDKGASILTEILRARQEVELLKVPTIVELAQNHIEEGSSIAIFVNFKETIRALSERLKTTCIVEGDITGEERQANIDAFQNDEERIILCNIRAGGVGISLHDINGKYNRVSLISPSFSAQDLLQALGRIHRAGAKSPAIQKILFCAETIEEKIAKAVNKKIDNINSLNDGDLADEDILNLFNYQEVV